MIHLMKSHPRDFAALVTGEKTFEVDLDDPPYEIGDVLKLREYLPGAREYTGASASRRVVHILRSGDKSIGATALQPGHVVIGLANVVGGDRARGCREDETAQDSQEEQPEPNAATPQRRPTTEEPMDWHGVRLEFSTGHADGEWCARLPGSTWTVERNALCEPLQCVASLRDCGDTHDVLTISCRTSVLGSLELLACMVVELAVYRDLEPLSDGKEEVRAAARDYVRLVTREASEKLRKAVLAARGDPKQGAR
jgi:hypothetical protein